MKEVATWDLIPISPAQGVCRTIVTWQSLCLSGIVLECLVDEQRLEWLTYEGYIGSDIVHDVMGSQYDAT